MNRLASGVTVMGLGTVGGPESWDHRGQGGVEVHCGGHCIWMQENWSYIGMGQELGFAEALLWVGVMGTRGLWGYGD